MMKITFCRRKSVQNVDFLVVKILKKDSNNSDNLKI